MIKKNLFSYIITLISIIVIIVYVYEHDLQNYLLKTGLFAYFISACFALFLYFVSGIQYFFVRKEYDVRISKSDIVFFPIVMNLWSIILPFQGSFIFSVLFFKLKYKMKFSESVSINIYIYVITLSFAGFFSLFYCLYSQMFLSWFTILSLILSLIPFILIMGSRFITRLPSRMILITKLYNLLIDLTLNFKNLWLKRNFTLINFGINISRSILLSLWYLWIARSVNIEISYLALFLLSLIMQMTLIIKITPANLGIAQIVSGSFTSLAGYNFADGVIISLYATVSTFILLSTLGLYGNFMYLRQFDSGNFTLILKTFRTLRNNDTFKNII